jgi:bifunctional non-homologous end joining protein LigD
MADLKEYRRKRRFDRTPEPEGRVHADDPGRLFIIQKHAATRLHYDFRLELDGVLKSWAVPKGPSLDPAEKRLAVHVEDHPLEYGAFEGVIPEEEYGGGTVMLWDRGRWIPDGEPLQGYRKGHLKFRLEGAKLKGTWNLARMALRDEGKENWLLIKSRDDAARPGSDILHEQPLSVTTGRSMEEIAAARDRVWSGSIGEAPAGPAPARRRPATQRPIAIRPSSITGARKAPQPELLTPQLAVLAAAPPTGEGWLHEIKYDGYRILAFRDHKGVRLVTRHGNDWTDRFATIAEAVAALPVREAVLDGEVTVVKPDGSTDFQALQNVLQGVSGGALAYFAFDLPHCDGYDLTRSRLVERKQLLQDLLRKAPAAGRLRYSDHIAGGGGPDVFQQACRLALEGVVSKRADAAYRQKRTRDWVKVKCLRRQEFVVGGYTDPAGARTAFGALLLGYRDEQGRLVYAGRVGTGFNERSLQRILADLKALGPSPCPFEINAPTGRNCRGCHWVKPIRVAEVDFTGWTEEGVLRHPAFLGMREDKPASEVVREAATKPVARKPPAGRRAGKGRGGPPEVAGVPITHPDRVLFPEAQLTKLELAQLYERLAERVLPFLVDRPLTLVRCPQGARRTCFYQKHFTDQLPPGVSPIPIREKEDEAEESIYLRIRDVKGLIGLVQIGVLELHPWGSRVDRLEHPDMMIFDLDPGPGITHPQLVESALLVKERLDDLGLRSFVKTSGGKGFHIVVPLARRNSWEEVKAFSGAVAEDLVRRLPARFVATMTKSKRAGKVFLDYFRNARGSTSVAPYSTRARRQGSISMPIRWEDLAGGEGVRPDAVNVHNVLQWMQRSPDPWAEFFTLKQSLTRTMRRRLAA